MSLQKKTAIKAQRRALRVRRRIKEESDRVRVSVFKSSSHIYAQVIDDAAQNTIVSCSTLELKDLQGDKKEVARLVGVELAKRAQKAGVVKAVFDRGQFLYHGRVKSLAEGLREGGLEI